MAAVGRGRGEGGARASIIAAPRLATVGMNVFCSQVSVDLVGDRPPAGLRCGTRSGYWPAE